MHGIGCTGFVEHLPDRPQCPFRRLVVQLFDSSPVDEARDVTVKRGLDVEPMDVQRRVAPELAQDVAHSMSGIAGAVDRKPVVRLPDQFDPDFVGRSGGLSVGYAGRC